MPANDEAMSAVLSTLGNAIDPAKMSGEDALEFLQNLAAEIEAISGGIKDDLRRATANETDEPVADENYGHAEDN